MALITVSELRDFFAYDKDRVKVIDGIPYIELSTDDTHTVRIVKEAERVSIDDIPSAARKLLQPLLESGWVINLTQSQTLSGGGFYGPTAQKAGEPKPEKLTTWTWAHGFMQENPRGFSASWENTKPKDFALIDSSGVRYVERVGDFLEWIA